MSENGNLLVLLRVGVENFFQKNGFNHFYLNITA